MGILRSANLVLGELFSKTGILIHRNSPGMVKNENKVDFLGAQFYIWKRLSRGIAGDAACDQARDS
jgi:hypothetical protein